MYWRDVGKIDENMQIFYRIIFARECTAPFSSVPVDFPFCKCPSSVEERERGNCMKSEENCRRADDGSASQLGRHSCAHLRRYISSFLFKGNFNSGEIRFAGLI